jgi:hypothetical protein
VAVNLSGSGGKRDFATPGQTWIQQSVQPNEELEKRLGMPRRPRSTIDYLRKSWSFVVAVVVVGLLAGACPAFAASGPGASDGLPVPALAAGIVLAFAVGLTAGTVQRRRRAARRRETFERPPPVPHPAVIRATAPAPPAPPRPEPAAPPEREPEPEFDVEPERRLAAPPPEPEPEPESDSATTVAAKPAGATPQRVRKVKRKKKGGSRR